MARVRRNLVMGNLGADLTSGATAITFATALQEGGVNVPTIASPDVMVMRIGTEIVHLTAYTAGATSGTISRGRGDTVATTHATGDEVRNVSDKDEYASVLSGWFQDDVAAAQSAVALALPSTRTEIPLPSAAHIVGVAVYSNAARAAGTLTVDVTVNGTVTGLQAVLDGTNTQTDTTRQAQNLDKAAAGDRIGVKITTDGSWSPTTADIDVSVLVMLDGPTP